MTRRNADWIDVLPTDRLIGEFSVWSANLLDLNRDLARIASHADILHIDAADGHFAPALLFFPDLVAAIRKSTELPIHVHLMAADEVLLAQVDQFAEAGSDLISIHAENAAVANEALDLIEARGLAAGMALRVDTPVEAVEPYLSRLRFLTLLGTEIGVKGQGLDERATDRLLAARELIWQTRAGKRIVLAADGGIREHTAPALRAAGAEAVVLGSLAFGAPDLAARMAWLHAL